jgi:hypothetical protein
MDNPYAMHQVEENSEKNEEGEMKTGYICARSGLESEGEHFWIIETPDKYLYTFHQDSILDFETSPIIRRNATVEFKSSWTEARTIKGFPTFACSEVRLVTKMLSDPLPITAQLEDDPKDSKKFSLWIKSNFLDDSKWALSIYKNQVNKVQKFEPNQRITFSTFAINEGSLGHQGYIRCYAFSLPKEDPTDPNSNPLLNAVNVLPDSFLETAATPAVGARLQIGGYESKVIPTLTWKDLKLFKNRLTDTPLKEIRSFLEQKYLWLENQARKKLLMEARLVYRGFVKKLNATSKLMGIIHPDALQTINWHKWRRNGKLLSPDEGIVFTQMVNPTINTGNLYTSTPDINFRDKAIQRVQLTVSYVQIGDWNSSRDNMDWSRSQSQRKYALISYCGIDEASNDYDPSQWTFPIVRQIYIIATDVPPEKENDSVISSNADFELGPGILVATSSEEKVSIDTLNEDIMDAGLAYNHAFENFKPFSNLQISTESHNNSAIWLKKLNHKNSSYFAMSNRAAASSDRCDILLELFPDFAGSFHYIRETLNCKQMYPISPTKCKVALGRRTLPLLQKLINGANETSIADGEGPIFHALTSKNNCFILHESEELEEDLEDALEPTKDGTYYLAGVDILYKKSTIAWIFKRMGIRIKPNSYFVWKTNANKETVLEFTPTRKLPTCITSKTIKPPGAASKTASIINRFGVSVQTTKISLETILHPKQPRARGPNGVSDCCIDPSKHAGSEALLKSISAKSAAIQARESKKQSEDAQEEGEVTKEVAENSKRQRDKDPKETQIPETTKASADSPETDDAKNAAENAKQQLEIKEAGKDSKETQVSDTTKAPAVPDITKASAVSPAPVQCEYSSIPLPEDMETDFDKEDLEYMSDTSTTTSGANSPEKKRPKGPQQQGLDNYFEMGNQVSKRLNLTNVGTS